MIDDKIQKIELFEKFYEWLKSDGLVPTKSERLHKKKIFASLLSDNKMTIENFNDFLIDYKKEEIRALVGKTLLINDNHCFIRDIEFLNAQNDFKLISEKVVLSCKATQIERLKLEVI